MGQFTNEISKETGNYIKEFCSTGPKSNVFRTDYDYIECTLKGITFNHIVELLITIDVFKDMVKNHDQQDNVVVKAPQLVFLRNTKNWSLKTTETYKIFKFTYNKRVIVSEGPEIYLTYPYGY